MLSSLRENFRRTRHAFKHATATPPKVITISLDEEENGDNGSQDSPTIVTSYATNESPTTVASDTSIDNEEWLGHKDSMIMLISVHTDHDDNDSSDDDLAHLFGMTDCNKLHCQSQPPPDLKLQLYSKRTHKLCRSFLVHKDIVAFGPRASLRIADLLAAAETPGAHSADQESYKKNLDHSPRWVEDDESSYGSLLSLPSTSVSNVIELNEQQAKIVPQLLNFVYFYKSGTSRQRGTKEEKSATNGNLAATEKDSPATGYTEGGRSGEMLVSALKILYESAIIFQIPKLQSVVTYELFNDQMLPHLTVQMAVNIVDFIVLDISPIKPPSMLEEDDPLLDSTIQFLAKNLVKYAVIAPEMPERVSSQKQSNGLESTASMLPPPLQELATTIEPVFLLQILHENKRSHNEALRLDGITRSKLIAHCVNNCCFDDKPLQHAQKEKCNRKRWAKMTKEMLHKLTDEEFVEYISPQFDAPVFLLAESKLRPKQKSSDCSKCRGRRRRRHGLSRLEKRCIQSIASEWKCCYKDYCTTSSGLLEFLHKLPTAVLMEMFMATALNINHTDKKSEDGYKLHYPDGKDINSMLVESVQPEPTSHADMLHQQPLTRYRLIDMILQLVMDQVIPKTPADY